MVHWSENAKRLDREVFSAASLDELSSLNEQANNPDVWFLIFPSCKDVEECYFENDFETRISQFVTNLPKGSILCFLSLPEEAVTLTQMLQKDLKYQLWVSIKFKTPIPKEGFLARNHCELLVFSKYTGSLKHTKTRIAYTYCPACDKTTKDYGGKKHLYHEYGTLMSDVWRDIVFSPTEFPEDIVSRLQDLFGIEPHKKVHVVDLSKLNLKRKTNLQYNMVKHAKSGIKNIDESRLYNDDCLKSLGEIPSDSIDYCFADPPYNIKKTYHSYDDDLDIIEYFQWCDAWLSEMMRVLKPGKICTVLNIPLWAIRHFQHLREIGVFNSWITWEGLSLPIRQIMPANYSLISFSKGSPTPLPGLSRKDHNPLEKNSLMILKEWYCSRTSCAKRRENNGVRDREIITDIWWDIHRLKHNTRRVDHPCQLPPILMSRLISLYTNEGDIVLDPFNGVGTTTLVAQMLNRKYIGIEISKEYHNKAKDRHNILKFGGDPFEKNKDIPKAKNSRVKRVKQQKYVVPKKTLQLEVREIAKNLGRIPTREELEKLSRYPIDFFDEYFIDWGEVCAAAKTTGMTETRINNNEKKINLQMSFDDM